ncbi:MAG: stage V sporulation T C-terminal domain-containing protein [Bacilli bacterium]
MKSTGILRRIDNLGRIVIPKEIRKSLRIKDGEYLDISILDERIILQKHSLIKIINDEAQLCIDVAENIMDVGIIITDREKVIATSSNYKKKYFEKDISKELEQFLINKENKIDAEEIKALKIIENEIEEVYSILMPIVVNGDSIGLLIILSEMNKLGDFDKKIANFIVDFLARQYLFLYLMELPLSIILVDKTAKV